MVFCLGIVLDLGRDRLTIKLVDLCLVVMPIEKQNIARGA